MCRAFKSEEWFDNPRSYENAYGTLPEYWLPSMGTAYRSFKFQTGGLTIIALTPISDRGKTAKVYLYYCYILQQDYNSLYSLR